MKQPTGFVTPGTEGMVCRLNKSLYGLKQARRTWNKRIDVELKAHGFVPIDADPCVYAYKRGSVVLIISLYVDDLLLASDSLDELNKVKAELQTCFDMEDMGEASYALGIKITRDRAARTLTISQGAYILDVLIRFDMQDSRPVSTPMEAKCKLEPATATTELDSVAKTRYQSAVGALMHTARATRPDISFAVTALSQFCKGPDRSTLAGCQARSSLSARHCRAWPRLQRNRLAKGITRTARLLRLRLRRGRDGSPLNHWIHVYSQWSRISWASRKQPTVAHSSTEAEYMAASDAAKEAVWWRLFLSGLGYPMDDATRILSITKAASLSPRILKATAE